MGLGAAIARAFANEGAGVGLLDIDEQALTTTVQEIVAGGGKAVACPGDVSKAEVTEGAVKTVVSEYGGLDVLVNNAGGATRRSLDEVPDPDWQAAWELNVMAPLRAMRAAVPGMAARGWGRIVNVSSSAAKRPSGLSPEYAVTKAAELAGQGRDEALAAAGAGRPIGRLAEVREIADAIVFLCSERASYVAGAAWSVDGGSVPVII